VIAALLLALAATPCAARERVAAGLLDNFGETLRTEREADDGRRIEVYRSDMTGSWTLLMVYPDGTACMIGTGRRLPDAVPGFVFL
jgi:hypothetical protein